MAMAKSQRYDIEVPIGNAGAITKTLDSVLQNFGKDVSDDFAAVLDEVGKEAVQKLKASSPSRSGNYAKGWKYKRQVKGANGYEAKVYNAKRGNLTHLIEFGHPIVRGGVVVGNAKAEPHIEPVNQWVQSELPKRFAQKMKNL